MAQRQWRNKIFSSLPTFPRNDICRRCRAGDLRFNTRQIYISSASNIQRTSIRIANDSFSTSRRSQRYPPQTRSFATSHTLHHGDLTPPKPGEERHITFIDKEGRENIFVVADGDNLLDIAQANDLEMEGACGGSCACSTCHVIVKDEDMYDKMEEPSDDENDMLDLAFGLTETSRLGCQVAMSKGLDGLVVKLPSMTRNMQASDFEKK